MNQGRIHWYEPDELDAEQRAVYDAIAGGPRGQGFQPFPLTDRAGRLNGPFNAMLASPPLGSALQRLGAAVHYQTDLTSREREIATLEVSARRRSEFEWYAHERIGRHAGLTGDEIAALKDGAAIPSLSEREALVRDVVRTLIVDGDLADELFARARARNSANACSWS
jgi:alkylhydroperoxidase family enzyme